MMAQRSNRDREPAREGARRSRRSPADPSRALSLVCFAVSGALLAQWAWTEIQARDYQATAARVFEERAARSTDRLATAGPGRASVGEGDVVGRMRISRIGLSAMIGEGTRTRLLDRALGHVPGTALPGARGNVGIAGHRDTFFRRLGRLRRGDRIMIDTPRARYEYVVSGTRVVSPRSIGVLGETGEPILTLVTCYPFHAVGPAPERFIVRARLVRGSASASRANFVGEKFIAGKNYMSVAQFTLSSGVLAPPVPSDEIPASKGISLSIHHLVLPATIWGAMAPKSL